ncbi:MAG: HDIG domain-containing metalloprotein [Anaerolineaceae bacterium]
MLRRRPLPIVSRRAAALFGLLLALSTVLLVVPVPSFNRGLKEGDIASRTLDAARDSQFESAGLTEAVRKQEADRVPDQGLPLDPAQRQLQVDRIGRFLDQVRIIAVRSDSKQAKLDLLTQVQTAAPMLNSGRLSLLELDRPGFEAFAVRATKAMMEIHSRPLQQVDITPRIDEYLTALGGSITADEKTTLRATLTAFVTPTFQVDTAATEQKRAEARAHVSPQVVSYTRGQVIVNEGQRIKAEDIEALKATGVIDDTFDPFAIAGGAAAALGLGALIAAYAYLMQPFQAPHRRRMVLVGVSIAAVLVGARVVLPLVTPDADQHYFAFALPVAAAAIICAAFADVSLAAVVAVGAGLFAVFIGAAAPQLAGASFVGSLESLELGMAYIAGGLVGAAIVHRADRLGRYALASVGVTLATAAVLLIFWLIGTPRANTSLGWIALASGLNGLASAVIAIGAFVILSLALGITTRIQLMELAQSDHPLLRRLQDEAPGTYHHSMLVGALAERAASAIGADALIVRAGAYYHDIGKLAQPSYYVENTLDGAASPHDAMEPTASAAVIRDHVTNGIEIARRNRIPAAVRDFIPQHHGTRLVTYFYRRANEVGGAAVDPVPFRYPGPRPQTKETAVVMLADSCEAIARARQESAHPTLEELIDNVIAERLAEGQLDECDITMRELQTIAASFKSTLRAVYHPRVQYPDPTPEEIAGLARAQI